MHVLYFRYENSFLESVLHSFMESGELQNGRRQDAGVGTILHGDWALIFIVIMLFV